MIALGLELVAGVMFVSALAVAAVLAGAIDVTGAVSGGLICVLALLAGGFGWLVVIIFFFALSSVLTRYRYEYKKALGSAQEKGGRRSWPNALANGGVAALASLCELVFHSDVFALVFLTSVATAMSDTLATEVGLLSHSQPRLITNLREKVKAGTSGGVSMLGELAAVLAAAIISLLGIILLVVNGTHTMELDALVSAALGAVIGVNADSLLGATVQSVRKCIVCGEFTESKIHEGKETTHVKGIKLVDNNVVNLLGIVIGSIAAVLAYWALSGLI